MGVSAIDPLDGAQPASTRELRLIQTLVSIRLRGVTDPEGRRHMNWVSDLVSAMSLMVERGARPGAPDFGTYMEETLSFWTRLCESRGLKLSVNGEVPALPDSVHLPLAIVLHEIMGEVVRHYEPGAVGQAAAVAFAASATDISMVVSATTPPGDDAIHAESMALVEGLVTLLGGQAARSDAQRGGLTVKIHLPLTTRQLQ
jgi:two-component sensor histidine kinase